MKLWGIGVTAVTFALVIHSFADAYKRDAIPTPFVADPEAGFPTIAESPWHPLTHLNPKTLPWRLDPIETWPEDLRKLAHEPCGVALVLQRRYPLWLPPKAKDADPRAICRAAEGEEAQRAALVEAGFTAKANLNGATLAPTDDGWVLERHQKGKFELVVSRDSGLIFRRTP